MSQENEKDFDWKETNVALIGSDLDKEARKKAALEEKVWEPVIKNEKEKLFVWRLNKFELEPVPEDEHGTFYNGDSYVILNCYKENEKLLYDVHFWIGQESSADEYGTAAYKTVEIDTLLNDLPIQHREVQNFESDLFKSYFENIKILKGGYESGFKRVTINEFKPILYHFHYENKKYIIQEVSFTRQSLNSSDVFILDEGDKAIQWNGKTCNKEERFEAAKFCQKLENDRHGKCKAEVVDENDHKDDHDFKEKLPDVAPKTTKGKKREMPKSIYKLTDSTGKPQFVKVMDGSICKSVINEDDVFVINGGTACFVYVGEKCSDFERTNAMLYAHEYLKTTENPLMPITVVSKTKKSKEFERTLG